MPRKRGYRRRTRAATKKPRRNAPKKALIQDQGPAAGDSGDGQHLSKVAKIDIEFEESKCEGPEEEPVVSAYTEENKFLHELHLARLKRTSTPDIYEGYQDGYKESNEPWKPKAKQPFKPRFT